jgi:sec-independent protein translocase protein TatA
MFSGLEGHWWVILLILVIVLIIWGPGKMPDVGAGLGRAIREFRNGMSGVRDTVVDATQSPVSPTRPADPGSGSPAAGQQPPATVPDDTRPR